MLLRALRHLGAGKGLPRLWWLSGTPLTLLLPVLVRPRQRSTQSALKRRLGQWLGPTFSQLLLEQLFLSSKETRTSFNHLLLHIYNSCSIHSSSSRLHSVTCSVSSIAEADSSKSSISGPGLGFWPETFQDNPVANGRMCGASLMKRYEMYAFAAKHYIGA